MVKTASALIIQSTNLSPSQVIENIKKMLQSKGVTLFATIDHSGAAHKAELELPIEQLLIFGDPRTGTFLMQENPEIGIELPLKILVWQKSDGTTQIGFKDPLALGEQYGIRKHADILHKMRDNLTQMLNKITGNKNG